MTPANPSSAPSGSWTATAEVIAVSGGGGACNPADQPAGGNDRGDIGGANLFVSAAFSRDIGDGFSPVALNFDATTLVSNWLDATWANDGLRFDADRGGVAIKIMTPAIVLTYTLQNGEACGGDSACSSGNCTDGYCCGSADCGTCRSCGESGSEGTCTDTVGVACDDNTYCNGTDTCGSGGNCNQHTGDPCS